VIVERARELGISLILMTTHGRSGLGRLVFGSIADSVLRHAACPVLLVRITDADDALKTA
jgi:nucleotide-binding universal stress UspA family protein